MTKHFQDYAPKIWGQILGRKGLGISSARAENLVLILEREIGLSPTMIRVDDTLHPYTTVGFKRINITSRLDGSVTVFYLPKDCEDATGSQAQNWTQWSSNLLGYKRKSHKMALHVRPPVGILNALAKRGLLKGRRRHDFRFLSLELVIFYLAAQTRTWSNAMRILTIKDFIEKHDINTNGFIAAQEEIDVENLFPHEGDKPAPVKPSGIPKAGQGLVNYNPTVPKPGNGKTDPLEEVLDALIGSKTPATPEGDLLAGVDANAEDDALEAEILDAKRKLAELVYRQRTRKFYAEAEQGKIVGGEVWPDRGEWAFLKVEYPNGTRMSYYHRDLIVAMGLGGDLADDSTLREAIEHAHKEIQEAATGNVVAP